MGTAIRSREVQAMLVLEVSIHSVCTIGVQKSDDNVLI